MEVVAVDRRRSPRKDPRCTSVPQGRSTAGNRQVTGSDEPAMKGKPIARAVSTISLAQSQLQERCLSLKTGTPRPVSPEHVDNLLKELVAGVKCLPLFVPRIIAVLADDQDAIDGQLRSPLVRASAIVG